MDIVLFGSYDIDRHPRVAVLRDGLRAHGHDVTEINEPLGLSTADKVDAASSLAGAFRLGTGICRSWWRLVRSARRHRSPDVVVVGYLGHFDVHLARLLWPRTRIVLDHLVGLADTVRDRGLAKGLKFRLLAALDHAALQRADLVVVDTKEQLDELPGAAAERAVVVPVGATQEWFDLEPAAPELPIRVVFVGLYTPLHGAPTIGRAIALLAADTRIAFTMVGDGQDRAATEAAAGGAAVDWIDWLSREELRRTVASQHVGLGIFGTTGKAARVVPTKVYQSLAAGNVVITSDTAAQRDVLGDAVRYVPAGDAEALAAALVRVADEAEAGSLGPNGEGERFTPERCVAPLLDRLGTMTRHRSLADGPALPPNAWLRFDLLRRHLEPLPRSNVLEIGPGRGALAARIAGAGHRYTGVEMSDSAREHTREHLDRIDHADVRLLASLEELDPEDRFDLVCAFEVLEHVEDDTAALRAWVSRLEPGGLFLVSVPAFQDRFSSHDLEVGHLRRYEPAELRDKAIDAGLIDVQVRLYGFPLGYPLERARNLVSSRIQRRRAVEVESAIERTKRSGSWFQAPAAADRLFRVGTWPFRLMQRPVPTRGTGLVLAARRPVD